MVSLESAASDETRGARLMRHLETPLSSSNLEVLNSPTVKQRPTLEATLSACRDSDESRQPRLGVFRIDTVILLMNETSRAWRARNVSPGDWLEAALHQRSPSSMH